MSDFAQLHLHFTDHVQWRYEVIRPLVLFADRAVTQRAQETHLHPDTVRSFTRRFQPQGMLGLFPATVEVVPPSRRSHVPEAVVQETPGSRAFTMASGIANWRGSSCQLPPPPSQYCQKALAAVPRARQRALPFETITAYPTAEARREVMTLYAQGWSKRSISRFLQVSRPTITRGFAF